MTFAANWYILPPSITEVLQKQVSGGGGGGGGGALKESGWSVVEVQKDSLVHNGNKRSF